ncbi:MAG TPA: hypothetical protein VH541_06180 [Gaiellaceae bacterium]
MTGSTTLLRLINWGERWALRFLDAFVRVLTAALAKLLQRGRYRSWRGGT